jgi:hypothetical protein
MSRRLYHLSAIITVLVLMGFFIFSPHIHVPSSDSHGPQVTAQKLTLSTKSQTSNGTTAVDTQKASTTVTVTTTAPVPRLHAVTYASHAGRDDRFCRAVESALRHKGDRSRPRDIIADKLSSNILVLIRICSESDNFGLGAALERAIPKVRGCDEIC